MFTCVCVCVCVHAHPYVQCYSGSLYITLRTSLVCPLELSHLQSVQKPCWGWWSWSLKYWFIWPPLMGLSAKDFFTASVNWKEKTVMHFWGYLPWTNVHLIAYNVTVTLHMNDAGTCSMCAPLVFVYSDSLFPPHSCKDRNCSACYTSGLGLACHISSNCSSVLTVASQDEAYHRYRNAPKQPLFCFWVLYVEFLSFGWSWEVIS